MTRFLFPVVLLALTFVAASNAQDRTYTPVSGEFVIPVDVKPQPDGGVATQAISLFRVSDGQRVACVAASNDTVADVNLTVPTSSLPMQVQGRAWENPDCSGQQTDSVNTGLLQLGPPAAPELLAGS